MLFRFETTASQMPNLAEVKYKGLSDYRRSGLNKERIESKAAISTATWTGTQHVLVSKCQD